MVDGLVIETALAVDGVDAVGVAGIVRSGCGQRPGLPTFPAAVLGGRGDVLYDPCLVLSAEHEETEGVDPGLQATEFGVARPPVDEHVGVVFVREHTDDFRRVEGATVVVLEDEEVDEPGGDHGDHRQCQVSVGFDPEPHLLAIS